MMKLTASERQTLSGPLVVGCLLGTLVGIASWSFNSEYGHLRFWQMALDALGAFAASVVLVVGTLGIIPLVIRRLRGKEKSKVDETTS